MPAKQGLSWLAVQELAHDLPLEDAAQVPRDSSRGSLPCGGTCPCASRQDLPWGDAVGDAAADSEELGGALVEPVVDGDSLPGPRARHDLPSYRLGQSALSPCRGLSMAAGAGRGVATAWAAGEGDLRARHWSRAVLSWRP